MSGVRGGSPSFGLLASPCPECGHKALHQAIGLQGERAIVVRASRYCGADRSLLAPTGRSCGRYDETVLVASYLVPRRT